MSTKARAAAAARELERRAQAAKLRWDPQHALFDAQRTIFNDTARDRAVVGTRQFGKSTLAAVEGIDACLTHPRTESIYVDLTIDHAVEVLLPEVRRLLDTYNVAAEIVDDHVKFANGSVFHLMSLASRAEAKKLQGHRAVLMIFDEMQDLAANIGEALEIVRPALARHQGRLLLMGIPGPVLIGPWYDATEGAQKHLYGQYRVSILDNPHIPNAQGEVDQAELRLGATNPLFLRHWKGVWAYDPEALVYRYTPERNAYSGPAPKCRYYTIGLDPAGTSDREAIVAIGFGNPDNKLWHAEEKVGDRRAGKTWDDTAIALGEMDERLQPLKKFYDYGSAKKALTLLYKTDKQLHLEPVPFKDLDVETARVNSLLLSGRLMIRKGSALEADLMTVAWDDKARAAGIHRYTNAAHPDVADAMRAALQAVDASELEGATPPPTPEEIERAAIKALFAPPAPRYGPPVPEEETRPWQQDEGEYGPPTSGY